MSFHTKYRPTDFQTVVNQSQVVDILRAEVSSDKLVSSYVFFWPRGTGKTSIARIFAKALNCNNLQDGDCCNECEDCNTINANKTLDLIEIDAASNTQVEKIRAEIIDKAMYPPTVLKKKVYIIDEVHMLSISSFNALLKIMEEPPSYLVFILATTEISKVPDTIISRCQVFNFKKLVEEDMTDRMAYVAKEEGIEYDREALSLISRMSDGALRDALKYLEQVSILGKIDTDTVSRFLGVLGESQIEAFLEKVKGKDLSEIFWYLDDMQSKGVDFKNFTREILVYLDEHLMDDLDENLKLANCFKGIYNEVRYYPIPVLAFKTGLGQFMGKGLQDNSILQQSESKKIEKVQVKKPIKKELVQKEKEVEKVEEKKEVPKEKEQKIENKGPSGDDTKDIKQQLVENIENLLVRSVIKTFSHIDSIEDNKLEIVIINETQYKMISNPEKLKIVEDCVAKLFGDVKVLVKYMSKEDFLQKKLKG